MEASGHTKSGAHEIFATLTSILLNDEKVFRDFLSKISNSANLSEDILRHIRYIGVMNPENAKISNLPALFKEAKKLTPATFIDILKCLFKEYRDILSQSEWVPKSAEIFRRIDKFLQILDEFHKMALNYQHS